LLQHEKRSTLRIGERMLLQGQRITLKAIEEEDLPVLYKRIYGEENPEWKKYDAPYFRHHIITFEEYREQMSKKLKDTKELKQLVIMHDGNIIGMVSYYWEYEPTRWLEVGITIYSPSHWSGGFGTEALSLWIDYLFQELVIERVGLTTWSGNPRMIRCAEKLGMQLEGRMRKCRYYEGTYYDSIRMGVLREEWEELQKERDRIEKISS
jgi:RimJ/RimL family protein N-acetyltransferase